jgi:hypothetical protein
MAKTTKKPMRETTAKLPPALKAMENMAIDTADLDVYIKQLTEKLNPAGISASICYVAMAGRNIDGSNTVQVNIGSNGYGSPWPELFYRVAEGRSTSISSCCSPTIIMSLSATTSSKCTA